MKVGVYGLGSFGKFVIDNLPESLTYLAYDPLDPKSNTFQEVAECDVLVLAVPLSSYRTLLNKLKMVIKPDQLIVDICSVKVVPESLINEYLPGHPNLLLSHPLFGPQSYIPGGENNKIIVTKSEGQLAADITGFLEDKLGLEVINMTADEHDKVMSKVHALTFFVARGLSMLNVDEHAFVTPSFSKILDLIDIDKKHSDDLFMTIINGNPYARNITNQVADTFTELQAEIDQSKKDNPI